MQAVAPTVNKEKAAEAKEKGSAAFKANNFHLAVKCFTEAIDHDPSDHTLFSNRAAAYLSLGKSDKDSFSRALEDANKCIELKPDWAKGYARKGSALQFLGQYKEAVQAFAQGLVYDPTDGSLLAGVTSSHKSLTAPAAGGKKAETGSAGKGAQDETKAESQNTVIGIDLGTTYSCVAVWKDEGVVIIPNEHGERTMPSYVSFDDTGRYVGQQAKEMATRNPKNTCYDIKRIIGQRFTDASVVKDVEHFPFKVVPGPEDKPLVELPIGNGQKKLFAPEEISAMVLAKLKKVAEDYLHKPVRDAVITVPAYFSDAQRNATKAAGAIAGLNVLRIINEPTAAALSYGLDNMASNKMSHILIFDLGGGTFDVSILKIENGVFEVKATGGDTHLGGEDFDNELVANLLQEAEAQGVEGASSNSKIRRRMRTAAEKAKRMLSNNQSTEVRLEALGADNKDFVTTVTRAKFEQLNVTHFERCMDTVRRVLKDAKLKPEQIDEIVMVGGSTRIPKIQNMLQEMFGGKELCKSVNPDEAVAYGAAVQGAILSGHRNKATEKILLMDVTPLSLGIELVGRVMSVIIPRNTPIPCVKTQVYTTEENYQTAVDVCVYEGERMKTDDNNLLGKFTITGIEKAKRGEPKIDVSFALDSNGILTVTAKDQNTGAEAKIEIANRSRASDADIERMVKEAEAFRREDEMRLKKVEAINQLEACINEANEYLQELGDNKLAKIIEEATEKTQAWLDENRESAKLADINAQTRALERRLMNRNAHK